MIRLAWDLQRIAFGIHFGWEWPSQCEECGRGHVALGIYIGPLRVDMGL